MNTKSMVICSNFHSRIGKLVEDLEVFSFLPLPEVD